MADGIAVVRELMFQGVSRKGVNPRPSERRSPYAVYTDPTQTRRHSYGSTLAPLSVTGKRACQQAGDPINTRPTREIDNDTLLDGHEVVADAMTFWNIAVSFCQKRLARRLC